MTIGSGKYEWATRPPNLRERIVAMIWIAAFLFTLGNLVGHWGLLRGYDQVVLACLMLAGIVCVAFMPRVRELPFDDADGVTPPPAQP